MKHQTIRVEAFVTAGSNKIFLGNQPCLFGVDFQRFEDLCRLSLFAVDEDRENLQNVWLRLRIKTGVRASIIHQNGFTKLCLWGHIKFY